MLGLAALVASVTAPGVAIASSAATGTPRAVTSVDGGPAGIACPTASWCAAVGTVGLRGADHEEVLEPAAWIRAGRHWTHRLLPMPGGVGAVPEVFTASISCPAAGACVAVGAYFLPGDVLRTRLFAETLSGGKWRVSSFGLPAGTATSIFAMPGDLDPAISCSSLTSCTVVGAVELRQAGGANSVPAVWRLRGTRWTSRRLGFPPGTAAANRMAFLSSVSCPDTGRCVAVGYHEDTAHRMVPLIESYTRDRWTAVDGLVSGSSGSAYLRGVDCPTAISCVAVGWMQVGSDSPDQRAFVATLRGSRWAAAALPRARGIRSASLESVSCTGPGTCVAVGWSGRDTFRPYAERLQAGRWTVSMPTGRPPLDIVSCATARDCASTTGLGVPARDRIYSLTDRRWSERPVGLPR
jgi:hypothetical protein